MKGRIFKTRRLIVACLVNEDEMMMLVGIADASNKIAGSGDPNRYR